MPPNIIYRYVLRSLFSKLIHFVIYSSHSFPFGGSVITWIIRFTPLFSFPFTVANVRHICSHCNYLGNASEICFYCCFCWALVTILSRNTIDLAQFGSSNIVISLFSQIICMASTTGSRRPGGVIYLLGKEGSQETFSLTVAVFIRPVSLQHLRTRFRNQILNR